MCTKVADDLEKLLPLIEAIPDQGGGPITPRGGYAEVTRKFVSGCREAVKMGESLIFG